MEELIKEMGGFFRGLWRSRQAVINGPKVIEIDWTWYVTFECNGDLLETNGDKTPEEALKTAIKILEQ